MMYCVVNETTINDIGRMDNTMWEIVNTRKLQNEYNIVTNNLSFAKSPPTSTATPTSSPKHHIKLKSMQTVYNHLCFNILSLDDSEIQVIKHSKFKKLAIG